MTNSPRHPKRPHRRGREPATIDLKATVIPDPEAKSESGTGAGTGPNPATAATPETAATPAQGAAPRAPETKTPEVDREPARADETVPVPDVARSEETKAETENKGQTWHVRERRHGSFQRSFSLTTPIDSEKANAKFEHGVLTLTLPKAEAAKPAKSDKPAKKGKSE